MSADEEVWSSECPTVTGEYELKSMGFDYGPVTITREVEGKKLWASTRAGNYIPLDEWHEGLTNPQWRPAKAVGYVTDGFVGITDEELSRIKASPQHAEMKNKGRAYVKQLETRLADAEKRERDWKTIAGRLGDSIERFWGTEKSRNYYKPLYITEALAELRRAETQA